MHQNRNNSINKWATISITETHISTMWHLNYKRPYPWRTMPLNCLLDTSCACLLRTASPSSCVAQSLLLPASLAPSPKRQSLSRTLKIKLLETFFQLLRRTLEYVAWFLDAHCQKQWASLGVIFWGEKKSGGSEVEKLPSLPKAMSISRSKILRKKRGGDRSWKVALGKGSWIC